MKSQKQFNLKFSDPDKLFAEVVFSVTQDLQWKGVDNPLHRINIIAKLLRQKQWNTPKGFYKHWDIGQTFREKQESIKKQWEKQKEEEINPIKNDSTYEMEDEQLNQVEQQIFEKGVLINQLIKSIYQQSEEEVISGIQDQVNILRHDLEQLWKQQSLIEKEREKQMSLCA